MSQIEQPKDTEKFGKDIFLLTKPPHSERAHICLKLIEQSKDPVIYLAGDGVYNLLGEIIDTLKIFEILPRGKIVVSKEDLEARGVPAKDMTIATADFYERLIEEMMKEDNRIFVF